jgi:putative ABC transport system substrate-binding protein
LDRRAFITFLGGTVVSDSSTAVAQQPAMPAIGFLDSQLAGGYVEFVLPGFRRGLKEAGYIEGENVAIEYRWAENQTERLTSLATELVRRRVALIVAPGNSAALAAKTATSTIPILFVVGEDPVKIGLVDSLARPGGNLTGVNFLNIELAGKRMELLRQMVPAASRVTLLVDPGNASTASQLADAEAAGRRLALKTQVLNASTSQEIEAAFSIVARDRPDALYVGASPFFLSRRVQLALLAARHGIPAIYGTRYFTEAGGLMNYGPSFAEAWRQVGNYAGRIFKGAKPADLPVVQTTKFELIINVEAARIIGLTVPPSLIAIADEVIE